jgi:hypothetical protein
MFIEFVARLPALERGTGFFVLEAILCGPLIARRSLRAADLRLRPIVEHRNFIENCGASFSKLRPATDAGKFC